MVRSGTSFLNGPTVSCASCGQLGFARPCKPTFSIQLGVIREENARARRVLGRLLPQAVLGRAQRRRGASDARAPFVNRARSAGEAARPPTREGPELLMLTGQPSRSALHPTFTKQHITAHCYAFYNTMCLIYRLKCMFYEFDFNLHA